MSVSERWNLDPANVIMDQFLDLETAKITSVSGSRNWGFLSVSFLDQETDVMDPGCEFKLIGCLEVYVK